MTTTTVAPGSTTAFDSFDGVEPSAASGTPHKDRRAWQLVTGLLLIIGMLASVFAMVFVIHDRVGFSPVLSPSMQPAFGPGDLIVTRSEPATAMKVGQIVALPIPGSPGQRYVHRLIAVRFVDGKPIVRTKGDANPAPEPYELHVTSRDVPVVVGSIPKIGRLSLLTERSTPRLILIAIVLVFGAVSVKRLFIGARHHDHLGGSDDD